MQNRKNIAGLSDGYKNDNTWVQNDQKIPGTKWLGFKMTRFRHYCLLVLPTTYILLYSCMVYKSMVLVLLNKYCINQLSVDQSDHLIKTFFTSKKSIISWFISVIIIIYKRDAAKFTQKCFQESLLSTESGTQCLLRPYFQESK